MNNESYDFEDRKYINPTLSRDEQLSFVDNYRNSQEKNLNQIVQDTHNLGTDVPSIEGGLNGSTDLWKTQYVTPRVNSMISSLRSSAQAQALNDVLSNVQAQWKKRYNDAYRAAALRENQNGNNGNNGNNTNKEDDTKGTIEYVSNADKYGTEIESKEPNMSGNPVTEGDPGTASNLTEEQLENIREWTKWYQSIYGGDANSGYKNGQLYDELQWELDQLGY